MAMEALSEAPNTQEQAYVFLHGLRVPRAVRLCDSVELLPATPVLDPNVALEAAKSSEDAATLLLFLPRISSQLRIVAEDQMALGTLIWNAGWDALLLGSAFACQVEQNIESESPSEEVTAETNFRITNYHLHGWHKEPVEISEDDCSWLEANFGKARALLGQDSFSNSMHCLASYRWHPHPRSQLALIWAGIEALFRIDSELTFRLSLAAAKFLEPADRDAAKGVFRQVKKLYKFRSLAVHGAELKGDSAALIAESAHLLQRLLRRCIETQSLPNVEELVL